MSFDTKDIESNARSHMANERTHLAYLRTSLALISFGVTLNRFSIYLRENHAFPRGFHLLTDTASIGIGVVILGTVILGWALRRYRQVERALDRHLYSSPKLALTVLTFLILFFGSVGTLWMFLSERP